MAGNPRAPNSPYRGLNLQAIVDIKRANRMNKIDQMPPELRALVNDYGYNVVQVLMDVGVTKPSQIRHVVERILDDFSPTRGSASKQGIRGEPITAIRRS